MTTYDKVLIITIIITSTVFMIVTVSGIFSNNTVDPSRGNIVIRSSDGSEKRIKISSTFEEEPFIVKVEGPIGTHVIEAYRGRVRVKEPPQADPHKICYKTGWIDRVGPMIICVPNQLSIWIEERESELDGVSW